MKIPMLGWFVAVLFQAGWLMAGEAVPGLFVEGYAGRISYAPGERAEFHVSTSATRFDLQIERLGAERRTVLDRKGVAGHAYEVPEDASSKGCGWPVALALDIPADWSSGYYEATLRVADAGGKFIHRNRRTAASSFFFVVRSAMPGKNARILLQIASNTYNAYNNWGGTSLYGYHGRGGVQGHEVSFLRPPNSLFSRWELDFVAWAERNGFVLDYASNLDLQLRPDLLDHYRLVLSVGHDEYWSWEMRDALEAFVARGGNAAFFSGNSVCWQVRWQQESRSLLSWKQWYNQDPVYKTDDQPRLSSLWSHHLVGRPENQLTGVGFLHGGYHKSHGQLMDGKGAFTVHRPEHWVFEGTSLGRGDEFGGRDTIVGYECDGCELEWRDGMPYPTFRDGTPRSFEVLATCPARWAPGDCYWYERWPGPDHAGNAVMGVWRNEAGGIVFTAGTTDWAHGLRGNDPAVGQITRNVLKRLGGE